MYIVITDRLHKSSIMSVKLCSYKMKLNKYLCTGKCVTKKKIQCCILYTVTCKKIINIYRYILVHMQRLFLDYKYNIGCKLIILGHIFLRFKKYINIKKQLAKYISNSSVCMKVIKDKNM